MGVTIAIDDFGTGCGNFDDLCKSLARAMTGIAHDPGLRSSGRGRGDPGHAGRAARLGCDGIQGYFTGRPMTAAALLQAVA